MRERNLGICYVGDLRVYVENTLKTNFKEIGFKDVHIRNILIVSRFQTVLSMVYNTRMYWVFELCP
jgi:hypothetical protein